MRTRHALPWVLVVVLAGALLTAWLRGRRGPDGAAEPRPITDALRLCRSQLGLVRRACAGSIARCIGGRARYSGSPAAQSPRRPSAEDRACLCDTRVEREVVTALERATEEMAGVALPRALPLPKAAVRGMLERRLGISERDAAWVQQFVCASRDLRQSTIDAVAAGEMPSDEGWNRLVAERRELLASFAKHVGEPRFEQLRAAGGIGLLADVLGCE